MRKKYISIFGCLVMILVVALSFVQASSVVYVSAETSTKKDGRDYVKYDKVAPDGRLNAYTKLYLPNFMLPYDVNGWHYLTCFDYFEIVRTDGRMIYDNDGVINTTYLCDDTIFDKSEFVNYPCDLYVETSLCEYNYNGAFGTVLNAKWEDYAKFTTIKYKKDNEHKTHFVEDDANTMGSGNYRNSGVNTSDRNYKIASIITKNEDYSKFKQDDNGFAVEFDGTAYWENGWWGGCGNYAGFQIFLTSTVYMKPICWDNEFIVNNAIKKGNYFYSLKPLNVVATNLNNFIKINNQLITPITNTQVLPYSDGFHIAISNNGLTKVSIENGGEGLFDDYYCVIDNSIPDVKFEYINTNAMDKAEYGKVIKNKDGTQSQTMFAGMFKKQVSVLFDYTQNESPESATYTHNGKTREYVSGQVLTEDGEYTLEVCDLVGNKKIISFVIDGESTRYNLERLSNDTKFKVSEWYLVDLPSDVHDTGVYSFATEMEALTFAKKKEEESFAVKSVLTDTSLFNELNLLAGSENDKFNEVKVGDYWYYKSKHNEKLFVYYFNKELFNEVLEFYAQRYVSSKQYYKLNDKNNYGAYIGNLTSNTIYVGDIEAYLIKDFKFLSVSEIETYRIFYDYAEDDNENFIEFSYNQTFASQVLEHGLFKIKELDYVGNETIYYVYIDKVAPQTTFSAKVYGSDDNFTSTIAVLQNVNNVQEFYFESFEFVDVIDQDDWWCVEMLHNGNKMYYTKEDVLPKLNDIGSGQFIVSIYDRSGNVFNFVVYILGNPPCVEFTNAIDNFTFDVNIDKVEVYNLILDIEIYKDDVLLNNPLGYDEYINNSLNELVYINRDILNYTFSKTGRYVVKIKDIFGRNVAYDYLFQKDLPSGLLSVENNSATRDSVTFEYNHNKFYVETLCDDSTFGGYLCEVDSQNYLTKMSYPYKENEVHTYSIKLINLNDEDNYVVYLFVIDRIIPVLYVFNVEGGGTTSKDVYLNWIDDNAKATYTLDNEELGEYNLNQILTEEGCYSVILTTPVGNTNSITFCIDKTLEYEILVDDIIQETDNVLLTNKSVLFKNNEPLYITLSQNDVSIEYNFGEKIEVDGSYLAHISDDYGNEKDIIFGIDTIAPTIELVNVENGCKTKNNVAFANPSEDIFEVKATKNGKELTLNIDESVSSIGKYSVQIFDKAGNYNEYSFEIIASFDVGTIALFGGILAVVVVVFCFVKKGRKDMYYEVEEE